MSTQHEQYTNLVDASANARWVRQSLAERGLPPALAKLYSQHTRLSTNQPGLEGWRSNEATLRLHDAMRLTACGLLEKELDIAGWQNSLRRAGEILEWLSHSELNPDRLPLVLIASAVYQLAGYPARSTGLLNQHNASDEQSRILYYFLKADFYKLVEELSNFWSEQRDRPDLENLSWNDETTLSSEIHEWITNETASAMGVLCAYMRWGDSQRIVTAINKLAAITEVLQHSRDPYSWLLAKLCTEVTSIYVSSSLRSTLSILLQSVNDKGNTAFEIYLRQSYLSNKALVWPSQAKGIGYLQGQNSFALCTPTGSGKTTIAEVAIMQSLFAKKENGSDESFSWVDYITETQPLALYLVPSRALATEIESKLSKVISNVSTERIVVTGLYGGNDWGPTDAWLTVNDRTILICTYEKAEALMRFLGPLFLSRVALIVIDEAHNIFFDGKVESLQRGESRSLRLESLSSRLLAFLEENKSRIIALSAVANDEERTLARWATGNPTSEPVSTDYRSTRQLIGCLECSLGGRTEIRYDLLDKAKLQFSGSASDSPYIPNPFPVCPMSSKWKTLGAEKRIRPVLFWAAMHLTQADASERLRSVLISTPQNIGGLAEDFITLLDEDWKDIALPTFFKQPTERKSYELWQQSLAACEDYFTQDSREYQLLQRGIVVHHGKMPGLLARLLIQLIEARVVNLVLATSTLSEGINLPFETVLITSLLRNGETINSSEFSNLVGRAGRPGFGTEGRSLVALPTLESRDSKAKEVRNSRRRYSDIIRVVQQQTVKPSISTDYLGSSPLAHLLFHLEAQWQRITNTKSRQEFFAWLEKTVPIHEQARIAQMGRDNSHVETLDSLDALLLAAIVELELLNSTKIDDNTLEERLQKIWRRTYAFYASQKEQDLQAIFIHRGLALKRTIYPDKAVRRQLYRTSLPPISGTQLLFTYVQILDHLKEGMKYITWTTDKKFEYIAKIVEQMGQIEQFKLEEKIGRTKIDWKEALLWWLDPKSSTAKPTKTQISGWFDYVSKFFQYRFNWGLGSLIALAIDEAFSGNVKTPSLEDWPQTQLPWIVFWLKELVVWGTLDPVVAYLLSHKIEITRTTATERAKEYYRIYGLGEANEVLNAMNIRKWATNLAASTSSKSGEAWNRRIKVDLARDFSDQPQKNWRVIPSATDTFINWLDPAGFQLARSHKPDNWRVEDLHYWDFWLDASEKVVISQAYI